MLEFLHIENIAVIEKADIELTGGFNVLTGETGAGKSIIIDSINAVLGERTSKDLIRSGCDKAEVSALFSNLTPAALTALGENGFSADEEGKVLIRRVLNINGNGSVRINGAPATVGILRNIGTELVDIHGQHDNHNLLDARKHCGYIDLLSENSVLLENYYNEFKNINSIRRELRALECDDEEKQRKIELLKYQFSELSHADIKVGETEDLKKKLVIIENHEKISSMLNNALYSLSGDDDSDGATVLLNAAHRNLNSAGESFKEVSDRLQSIICELEGITSDIRDFCDNNSYSKEEAAEIRERLDFLYRLMLKYGDSEEKMLHFLDNANEELQKITFSEQKLEELSDELDASTARLVDLAEQLTEIRQDTAFWFEEQVCENLKELNMPNVRFKVEINKGKYTKYGCDEVQFLISANSGEEVRPLIKIASGGELSRVMLAIKRVLAHKDEIPTLIFDEIDAGISGNAALKVGNMLNTVSKNKQVLCVTHLAQIAVFANTHLLIEKHTQNDRTFTSVTSLDYDAKVTEISRIMSGGELTDNLIKSAKELLDRSRN